MRRANCAAAANCAPPPRIARAAAATARIAPPLTTDLLRAAFFLGGVPVLKHKELVASPVDRFRLQTEPSGVVQINIGVVVKDFKKYGVSVS